MEALKLAFKMAGKLALERLRGVDFRAGRCFAGAILSSNGSGEAGFQTGL